MPGWEDALCTGICMSKGNFNRADRYIALIDPASYPHTSGVYNLMMSGGEYGSQKGWGAEPSVHE